MSLVLMWPGLSYFLLMLLDFIFFLLSVSSFGSSHFASLSMTLAYDCPVSSCPSLRRLPFTVESPWGCVWFCASSPGTVQRCASVSLASHGATRFSSTVHPESVLSLSQAWWWWSSLNSRASVTLLVNFWVLCSFWPPEAELLWTVLRTPFWETHPCFLLVLPGTELLGPSELPPQTWNGRLAVRCCV